MKTLAGIFGGLILAVLGFLLVHTAFAAWPGAPAKGAVAFFVIWVASIAVAAKAPSASKAWRRLLLTSSVFSFFLPLSGIISTVAYLSNKPQGGDHDAMGISLVMGALVLIGFFLGAFFLIAGLLIGRDKPIVGVDKSIAGSNT